MGELPQLAPLEKGFQDVLLEVEIILGDGVELGLQGGEILDPFVDPVIGDIVARRFGAEQAAVAYVLLGEAVLVMAADHRVAQIEIFDDGLELAGLPPGDATTKNDGDFSWAGR